MMQLFRKDLGIKTLSVLLAIMLWLFVLNNIDNPFQKKFLDVNVSILNYSSLAERKLGIVGSEMEKYVQVEVSGRKDRVNNISASDVDATVDFSSIRESGTKELPIKLTSKKTGVEVALGKQKYISVQVDKIVKKEIPVQVIQTGKPKENYKVTKVTANPQVITVEGIESKVNEATVAKTSVDVNNINKSLVLIKECKIYNKNDEEMADLIKNTEVEVSVDVAKQVRISADIRGRAGKDCLITGHTLSKDTVLVTGFPELLDTIFELQTDVVNVENISKTTEILTQVKVPEGLKIVNGEREVKVTVNVEQLMSKELIVHRESIILQNTDDLRFKYDIVPENVKFIVKGRQKDVAALDVSTFRFNLDLTGLSEGTHKVPLKIVAPNNDVNISGEYTVEVLVSKKQ